MRSIGDRVDEIHTRVEVSKKYVQLRETAQQELEAALTLAREAKEELQAFETSHNELENELENMKKLEWHAKRRNRHGKTARPEGLVTTSSSSSDSQIDSDS